MDMQAPAPGLAVAVAAAASAATEDDDELELELEAEEEDDAGEATREDTRFSLSQFLEQLFVQTFFPFSAPLLLLARGAGAAANVTALPLAPPRVGIKSLLIWSFFTFLPIAAFAVVAAWALIPQGGGGDALLPLIRADVLQVVFASLSLRTAIAYKYAFMARAVYRRRMRVWVSTEERQADQLITSWLSLSRATIEREVGAQVSAAARGAVRARDVDAFHLTPDALARLRAGLGEEARRTLDELAGKRQGSRRLLGASTRRRGDPSGGGGGGGSDSGDGGQPLAGGTECDKAGAETVAVPAHALVVALMLQAERLIAPLRSRTRFFLIFIGIVSTFGTTAARVSLGGSALGSSSLQTIVIVGAWVISATQIGLVFNFLGISAIDNERRCRALNLLGRLMLPPPPECGAAQVAAMLKASQEASAQGSMCAAAVMPAPRERTPAPATPVLALDSARAARAFLAARRLLSSFGSGFHARLLMVVTTVVLLGAGAAAFALASMLLATDAPTTLASVVIMHVLVFPVAAIIWLDLTTASRTNDAAAAHAAIVAGVRLELRFALHEHDDPSAAAGEPRGRGQLALHSLLPLLEDLERSLRVQEAPVVVFGHVASPTLTQSFVGLYLSVETTILSILIGRLVVGTPTK